MNIGNTLPSKIEDLAKFVLIGREQLNMVRAGIKALDKLDMAKDVREQKKAEAQMLAEALMDAEVRIGEILLAMPKASGKQENRGNRFTIREILTGEESSINNEIPKPEPKPIETKQEAAQKLGFNKQQVERFQTLAQHKEIVEQVKQEARANDDLATRTAVLQAVKARQVEEKKEERIVKIEKQIEDINAGKLPELQGKFSVVSVDPPWPYEGETEKITTYDPNGRRVANPYPEMSIEAIKSIELPVLDDSIVFLWTTHKFIKNAFDILQSWGFEYKATMVWDKEKIGMGAWLRMQCEFCLVGIKGKPYWENTIYRDIIREPRREHSRKPDAFFEMVENITKGRRLEYFSREKRNNWEVFGNDTDKF